MSQDIVHVIVECVREKARKRFRNSVGGHQGSSVRQPGAGASHARSQNLFTGVYSHGKSHSGSSGIVPASAGRAV